MSILKFGVGEIILFSEGIYSDFGYCGQVVTLTELDVLAEIEAFKAQHQPKSKYDSPDQNGFVAWLCATQKVAPLECGEVHLGEYGELRAG